MRRSGGTPGAAVHGVTALVAGGALVLQLVLVVRGHGVLDEADPPDLSERLVRFASYFTILSNLLVAVTSGRLALGRDLDRRRWRVLRLDAVVGIAVTGLVHGLFLRPLLDLDGADQVADRLLHVAVPLLAVLGWLLVGPRDRVERGDLLPSAVFPVLYVAWTLLHGAVSGWYPYPFVDVDELGHVVAVRNGLGVVALLAALAVGALWLDRRLPGRSPT